jgi:hypothetical protein
MSSQGRLSRWLERCLIGVLAHPVWFTLVVSLLVVGIANIVLTLIHTHLGLGTETGLEILILFVAVSVPITLTSIILRSELKTIYTTLSEGPSKAAPILLRFVSEEIRELGEKIADTRSDGIDLEPRVAAAWIRDRCFAVASGSYFATDVLVPSRFLGMYSDYLRAHRKYVEESSCKSVRINLASTRDLQTDFRKNPAAINRYQQWHIDAGVDLLHLDLERAWEIAEQCQLRKTIDFAVWEGEFALLVKYRSSGETTLRLSLVGEPVYRRCSLFFERIREEAKPFHEWMESGSSFQSGLSNRNHEAPRSFSATWSRLSKRARGLFPVGP